MNVCLLEGLGAAVQVYPFRSYEKFHVAFLRDALLSVYTLRQLWRPRGRVGAELDRRVERGAYPGFAGAEPRRDMRALLHAHLRPQSREGIRNCD